MTAFANQARSSEGHVPAALLVPATGGNVLFFCVAGQNRSATLAIAVQILHGIPLQEVLTTCAARHALISMFERAKQKEG